MGSQILLFGATGAIGSLFAVRALLAGNHVTLYVRSPHKLSKELSSHPKATVVVGNLTDKEKLTEAISHGADSCVLLIGGGPGTWGTPIFDGLKVLYPLLLEKGVKRVICLATPSFTMPQDKFNLRMSAIILFIRTMGPSLYKQVVAMGKLTTSYSVDEMAWTLPRIPLLTDGDSAEVYAGYVGDGKSGLTLSRKSCADWCLRELRVGEWIGKAPQLSNV